MEWSQKRKIIYATIFSLGIIILAAYPVYKLAYRAPTCSDGRQNGTEVGIDCGGSCALFCPSQIALPNILWANAFPLTEGMYDLSAYIENTNVTAGVKQARYTIRMLDALGETVGSGSGVVEIPPRARVLLFLPRISASAPPASVQVEFEPEDLARFVYAEQAPEPLVIRNDILRNTDTRPRLDATLVNTDRINAVGRVVLSAIISDLSGRPVGVSQTYVDGIPRGGEESIVFTWPSSFARSGQGGVCAVPTDTMVVLDRTNPSDMITAVLTALVHSFVETITARDSVGFVSFANEVSSPLDALLSRNQETLLTALSGIPSVPASSSDRNVGDALRAAVQELKSVRHTPGAQQAIVALVGGLPTLPLDSINPNNRLYAENYAAGVAAEARREGIDVYVVGINSSSAEQFFRNRIATSSAHYFSASHGAEVESVLKTISASLCKEETFIKQIIITPRTVFAG